MMTTPGLMAVTTKATTSTAAAAATTITTTTGAQGANVSQAPGMFFFLRTC